LTSPVNGIHAINLIVYTIADALQVSGYPEPTIWRSHPITTVANNFDKLYFPPDSLSRSPKYTRYLSDGRLLRTHTTAIIPDLLPRLRGEHLILHPGICYRRDVVDKRHVGEPHQMDVWLISKSQHLGRDALVKLIHTILNAVLPGVSYRLNEVSHPYTLNGLEIEVLVDGKWIEVGECGEAHPGLLPSGHTGLATGWGLDRLAMLVKGIDDIRLLRSSHPQIAAQMTNLEPYHPVSNQPSISRDMSIVTSSDTELEDICAGIVEVLGDEAELLESVDILSETYYQQLPQKVIQRLGIQPNQKNMLVRMTLRSLHSSISNQQANVLRDLAYNRIHKGHNLLDAVS
jgi:phenylalanyl-tRNA synthetase alpha chain